MYINHKVSVIIPTYNRAKSLERAVKSVIAQTYRPIEIIVINDGSTDKTDDIMKKLMSHTDPVLDFVYLKQNQKERVTARNNGINKATGDFICFLDDDDEFLPEKIKIQIDHLIKNPHIDCLFTNCYVKEDGNVTVFKKSLASLGLNNHSKEEIIELLCEENIIPIINIMIKASILKQNMFDQSFASHEDYELWLRLISKYKFDWIDLPLAIYHRSGHFQRYRYENKQYDILNIYFKYINVFPMHYNIMLKVIKRIIRSLKEDYINSGDKDKIIYLSDYYKMNIKKAINTRKYYIMKNYRGLNKYRILLDLYLYKRQYKFEK